jgi:hypothetical protein
MLSPDERIEEINSTLAELQASQFLGLLDDSVEYMSNTELNERMRMLEKEKAALEPRIVFRDNPAEKPKPFYKGFTRKNASNFERTGKRDQTLSVLSRWIGDRPNQLADGIRHIDGDLEQVCENCWKVYVYIEASADAKKKAFITRGKAEDAKHTAWAIRLIHHPHDINGEKVIKHIEIWEKGRKKIGDAKKITWEQYHEVMEKLHLLHRNRNGCVKRPFFED